MDIIVAALASWQIIEIWHHSSLFAPVRARTELWNNKIGELLNCPFCLSFWVALLCLAVLQLAEYGLVGKFLSLGVYAPATARLANLGNDFFKDYTLTPKVTVDIDADTKTEESVG